MAKGSRKRAARYDKDQSGCMWGLINIFDFRHGRPSQKLLADKKRGSRRIAGAAFPSDELKRLEDSCRFRKDANAGEQCETATIDKLSVKDLMEGEMSEQHGILDLDQQTVSDQQGHGRKNRWRTNKKSFDLNDVHIISDKPTHRKHKSLSSLDVTGMMAELCSQINVKDVDSLNHDETSKDVSVPPKEDPSVTEEKLGEATKVFISHFVDGKNTKEGKIQPSGELMDALQILNSNKDVFLKLLQDPSSQLMKHIQKLEDHQVCVDENSKVQAGSDLLEQGKSKHQSFFWRKFKGLDRNLSKKSAHSQEISTIVVLKPGPTSSQLSDTVSLQSSQDTRSKDQSERASSYFFFTEFTRKLKLAMRKEQPDKAVGGESLAMATSKRDHFFVEKIPKSSINAKKGNKAGKSREANSTPEQRISNIYAEAKKHLAEIVGNGDVDVDFLSRHDPKSLGRILSYPDYSSSPICSPKRDRVDSLTSPVGDSESGNEITAEQAQEENVDCAGLANNGSCITEETEDLEVPKDECNPLHSTVHEIHAKETRIPDETEFEKQTSLDMLSEPCSTSTCGNEQEQFEIPKDSKEVQSVCMNSDAVVRNQGSSPSASSSVCSSVSSITEDFEDPDATTDRSERPSPISVLEPIFKEDDISPPSIKSLPVAEFIQPRQIKFEDQISPAPRSRTWEEKKNSVFEFAKLVVRASRWTHDQLLESFLFSEHLLDPSLYDQLDFLPDHLCYDPKLLFDLIEEVLIEVCGRDFDGIPSFYEPYLRFKLKRKDIVDEICEGVDWHLQSEHMQHTLDQTIAKDFSKSWAWMDLRLDSENIGVEMEEDIFEELFEDTIMSLVSQNHGEEVPALPAELAEAETKMEM